MSAKSQPQMVWVMEERNHNVMSALADNRDGGCGEVWGR